VLYDDSILQYASKLNLIAIDRSQSSKLRTRARKQEDRAQHFDSLIQSAYRKSHPIRVVILLGYPNSGSDIGWDTSKVQYRMLDPEAWYVHSYSDGDGSCRLVRKIPQARMLNEEDNPPEQAVFVDQFSLSAPVAKHEATGFIFDRSPEVRRAVLERASGVCECCAAHGFKMDNGRIFLETHHVVPLSEKGPDEEWNVVAICPNDHRRAHFGEDRAALRQRLIEYLSAKYPCAEDAFRTLSNADSGGTARS
jgi:5-methylcytosine-specific restriction protein A